MDKLRGLVISNCQAAPLAQVLSFFCRDVEFVAFPVHLTHPGNREARVTAMMADAGVGADVVLSVPLAADYGAIAADRLADTFAGRALFRLHNLYLAGFHPDLTYIGGMGARVLGPMGDYHSLIVACAVAAGLGADDTLGFFRADVYRAMGFLEVYPASLAEFRRREAGVDVPFADEMEALLPVAPLFLTVNHPTGLGFGAYARAIAARLEAAGVTRVVDWPLDPAVLPNALATNSIFPIYPEIAAAHGAAFAGSTIFRPPINPGAVSHFTQAEFVAADHAVLAALGPERLATSPQVKGPLERFRALLG